MSKCEYLKQINQSELQVGKLYCDSPRLHGFNSVIMRYIGKIKGFHNFKYISGHSEYINEGNDTIRLAHYKKEPNWYWEVPKQNADIIEIAMSNEQQVNDIKTI
jgi:hypothetical protein